MEAKQTPRKKRVDRNHIVYMLVVNGLRYVGSTSKTESTVLKSVKARVSKHWYRAQTENKDWLICHALRQLNDRNEIEVKILAVVRGKGPGHKREVEIRRAIVPVLNSDCRGD